MNALRYSPYSDSFSRPVATSVAFHFLVILGFALRGALIPDEPLVIRDAILVDIVGLPDKPKDLELPAPTPPVPTAPPKAEPKPPVAKPEAVKPQVPSLKKAKEKQEKALAEIKREEALKKIQEDVANTKRPVPRAGNIQSEGNSLSGLKQLDFNRYLSSVKEQVLANWKLPGWLSQSGLRAQAVVTINEQGQVIKRQLVLSSGNDVFDAEVLEAIDRTTFPAPPEQLRDVLSFQGVTFNFPE